MPQVINTNIASMNAQRNLNKSQSSLQTSMQRLSSGLRINSARDDAAGLAISDRFTAQVNGLNQAARNANDGISLAQTAEGALDETTNSLQRMRMLAVQAANDTNTLSDRISIQQEIDQLVSEINRIGSVTQFNGKNLLDGSGNEFSFHIGANAGQSLTVTMADMRASALGQQQGAVQTVGTRVSLLGDGGNIGVDALANSAASAVAMTTGDLLLSINGGAQGVDLALPRYGGDIIHQASADLVDTNHINYGKGVAKDIAARVNAISKLHEVDATGKMVLAGVNAEARTEFTIGDLSAADGAGINGNGPALENSNVGVGLIADNALNINGVNIGPVDIKENDSTGTLIGAINSKTEVTGVKASIDKDGRLQLVAEDGRDIVIQTNDGGLPAGSVANLLFNGGGSTVNGAGVAGAGDDFTSALSLRITGQVTYSATDTIVVDATSANRASGGLDSASITSTGRGLQENVQAVGTIANADVTSVEGANKLMNSIDSALKQVDGLRAVLGAVQNRFEMTIRNLENVSENLTAANSRIRDADFAAETAMMTRGQILQQAGTAMLSQANAQTQGVLKLLQ